uniref:Uncharacterized protein n=1 Tax=Triticum aestivum TaxID=4565 RepID=A0A077RP63_WHEAT|nr:unnamed protein product [Triticum aestivum]
MELSMEPALPSAKGTAVAVNLVLATSEAKRQLRLAGPLIVGCLLQSVIQMISVMFVGHLGELALASASMASSFAIVTGFSFLPGCGFLGAPPALRGHLAERHQWQVTDIAYGSVLEIQMQAVEQGWRLLAAEDGEQLFLLVASERGVKVVRVAAPAEEEGWYRCKVWVHAPVDTDTCHMDVLMLDAKVESCPVPSEEAAMGAGGRYLPVPSDVPAPDGGGIVIRLRIDKEVKASHGNKCPAACSAAVVLARIPKWEGPCRMLTVEAENAAAGDGAASMEVPLHIRIDKLSPWSDALV